MTYAFRPLVSGRKVGASEIGNALQTTVGAIEHGTSTTEIAAIALVPFRMPSQRRNLPIELGWRIVF